MGVNTPFHQARYWQHEEKFTGMNGTWLGYVNELIKEVKYQMDQTKEGTRLHKVKERAMKLLQLIYNLRIQTREDFENKKMKEYVSNIKKKELLNAKRAQSFDSYEDIDTDIEGKFEDPGEHWIPEKPFRAVAEYLLNIIESSISGMAHDVIQNLGFERDRNGYLALQRLAEAFGRSAQHTACIPQNFEWGTNALHTDC